MPLAIELSWVGSAIQVVCSHPPSFFICKSNTVGPSGANMFKCGSILHMCIFTTAVFFTSVDIQLGGIPQTNRTDETLNNQEATYIVYALFNEIF